LVKPNQKPPSGGFWFGQNKVLFNKMKFIRENLGYLLSIILIGLFVYIFNLHNKLFWDDADWILNNPAVHVLNWASIKFTFTHDALAGIGQVSNYYRPVLFITLIFNYIVSGSSAVSYHLVSNFIHLGNSILLFYLISRWLKSRRAAFITALIFLVHPLQTEAVSYISGRGDPLSVFFILGGIALWLNGRRWWTAGAVMLAILSRETAVLFPIYLGLALVAFELPGGLWGRIKASLGALLPYIGISVLYGLLRLTVLNFQNTLNFYNQANVYSTNLFVRLYTFLHVLLVYLKLMIWPTGLHMDRDIPVSLSLWTGWAWLGALIALFLICWLFWLYKKSHNSNFPIWLFGLGLFFAALIPTMGIIPINARIYEHWLYFSIVGVAIIAGFYLDRLLSFLQKRKSALLPMVVIIMIGYFSFLSIQTIRRNILWGDTESFYKNILTYEPDDVRVLNNLGNWYSDHGDNTQARSLYEQAIAVDPSQPAPYHNIGNIIRDQGDSQEAIIWYQKAISADVRFHYTYESIAAIYLSENKIPEAIAILEKLQQAAPLDINTQRIESLRQRLQ